MDPQPKEIDARRPGDSGFGLIQIKREGDSAPVDIASSQPGGESDDRYFEVCISKEMAQAVIRVLESADGLGSEHSDETARLAREHANNLRDFVKDWWGGDGSAA